jgi:general secretion pathway protein B
MSYILDALRRADSERERGAVPGVHAQPVPLGSSDTARQPPAPRTWVWISGVLATVLLGLLAWQLMGRDASPDVAAPPQVATTPTPAVPAPVPVLTAPTPAPIAEPAPAPVPIPAAAPVAARPRNAAPMPAKTVAAAPAGSRAAAAAPAASAAVRVPTANELPEDIQRGLPTLVVGGASYSQNPENRMLIVNGQVLREGDKVGPEVTLEQIRLKEAVLSTKGHRYRIAY